MEFQVEDLRSEIEIIRKTDNADIHVLVSESVPETFINKCAILGIKTHIPFTRFKPEIDSNSITAGVIGTDSERTLLKSLLPEDRKIITYNGNYNTVDAIIDAYYYNRQY